MFVYWALFFIFAVGAVTSMRVAPISYPGPTPEGPAANDAPPAARDQALAIAALSMIVLIGFRYKVSADFPTYVEIFKRITHLDFSTSLNVSDPGYAALNWAVAQLGGGLWTVNLVCGILFVYGLVKFARIQPNPWLAITSAIPYLVIVVGMGYTRQSVAIGMAMAGLAAVSRGSFPKFIAYVLFGALFHRSVLILIPLITMAYSRNRLMAVTAGILGSIVGYWVLTSGGGYEKFQDIYVNHVMLESQGAGVRLAMNIPPAILFLLFIKRISPEKHERMTYVILSIIAFISLILLIISSSLSTPLDRMALYVIPLQLYVFSRLPTAFPDDRGNPSVGITITVVLYSAIVEFVWLNFATFAPAWIPYRFYPLHPFG